MGKKKNGTKKILIILIIIAIAIVAAGAVVILKAKEPALIANESSSTSVQENDGTAIQTPVGALQLPEEWGDQVEMKETSEASPYAVSFYTKEDEVFLFELLVGSEESTYQLGSAPDSDGNMQKIGLNISAIEPDASWSEEKTETVNSLQSGVNDLIEQINALEGFQEAE